MMRSHLMRDRGRVHGRPARAAAGCRPGVQPGVQLRALTAGSELAHAWLVWLSILGGVALLAAWFIPMTFVLQVFPDGRLPSPLVNVLSTLAIAALFVPLRRRVQSAIDRRFYRRKVDTAQTLAAFAATARDETDLDRLGAQLVRVVEDTLQRESAALWLRGPARDAMGSQAE